MQDQTNIPIFEETLKLIDWDEVTSILSHNFYFDQTIVDHLATPSYKPVHDIQAQFAQLKELLERSEGEDLQPLIDLLGEMPRNLNPTKELSYLEKSGVLDFHDLINLALLLNFFQSIKKGFPYFVSIHNVTTIESSSERLLLKSFIGPILSLLNDNHQPEWDKHPPLVSLYLELDKVDREAISHLKKLMSLPDYSNLLQYNGWDLYEEHYVLPIKSDSYHRGLGRILSHSQTRSTLYVEPLSLRRISDQRIEILQKINSYIYEFSKELCEIIRPFSSYLKELYFFCLKLDWDVGRINFQRSNLSCVPEISSDRAMQFDDLHHPIIPNCILNSFTTSSDKSGIILSGPNTGGKTVFLKSLAINVVFLHIGFLFTSKSARIFPFKKIVFFSGDHQKLQTGLSSFASEVTLFFNCNQDISHPSLFLIDEIFNSTGSDEASALAFALFDHFFVDNPNFVICTTHHHLLKVLAHRSDHYLSAHMILSPKTDLPTYKISFNGPGSSHALSTFQRLAQDITWSHQVTQKAQKFLNEKSLLYEKILEEVNHKNYALTQLIQENKNLQNQLQNQKKSGEALTKIKIQEEIGKIKEKFSKLFRTIESDIREAKNLGNLKSTYNRSQDQFNSQIKEIKINISGPREEHTTGIEIVENKRYFHLKLNKSVLVIKINPQKKLAQIKANGISSWVSYNDLALDKSASPSFSKNEIQVNAIFDGNDYSLNWDARGLRLDEFQKELENKLSLIYSGNMPFLKVIHGHGTGALKNHLKERISKDPIFILEQAQENDDGASLIKLR